MERKALFVENETYHLFSRGVDKRPVFKSERDSDRFLLLLLTCNQENGVRTDDMRKIPQGEPLRNHFESLPKNDSLVQILAYSLMPNHVHLAVREKRTGGISKFMLKLMTAYVMYFNIKYSRSGPLFTRPFRSKHIDSDEYLRWVFSYVHTNPLELFQHDWKERGLSDRAGARAFIQTYRWGSYRDYFGEQRPESRILDRTALPLDISELKDIDDLLRTLEYADNSTNEITRTTI